MHSATHEQGISDLGAQRCPMVRKHFPHRNVTSPPRRPGQIGRACRKLGHLIHPSHHASRHAFSQGAPSSASTPSSSHQIAASFRSHPIYSRCHACVAMGETGLDLGRGMPAEIQDSLDLACFAGEPVGLPG